MQSIELLNNLLQNEIPEFDGTIENRHTFIKMASDIGDKHRGVSVVGKTKEETMVNLLTMFNCQQEENL